MKPPAFQFYTDDFLGGTMHFTDAEVGLYVRLLCVQWNTGSIPDDDRELNSYGKAEPSTPIGRVKAKFVKGDDGKLRNPRMEAERLKQTSFREERSKSGTKGAEKRWLSHSSAIGQPLPNDSFPSPSPSPSVPTPTPSCPVCGSSNGSHDDDRCMNIIRSWVDSMLKNGADYTVKEAHTSVLCLRANGWKWGRNPIADWRAALERQIQTDRLRNQPIKREKSKSCL